MFGIEDPGIWSAYLLMALCIVFSVIFGIRTKKDNSAENK